MGNATSYLYHARGARDLWGEKKKKERKKRDRGYSHHHH
jgi:hypothetical protein